MRPHVAKARCRCQFCGSHDGIVGYQRLKTGRIVRRLLWCMSCVRLDKSVERGTAEKVE